MCTANTVSDPFLGDLTQRTKRSTGMWSLMSKSDRAPFDGWAADYALPGQYKVRNLKGEINSGVRLQKLI